MTTFHALGTILLGAGLLLQAPTAPPMKMGLWESTSNTKMSGMELPQGMTMPNVTVKVRSCMTPESYTKNLAASQRQQGCTRSNEVFTSKGFSFDISCKGTTNGHFEMTFDSMENGHAVMHMTVNSGNGHTMVADTTIDSHFVSADCGSVSPDKPEISH